MILNLVFQKVLAAIVQKRPHFVTEIAVTSACFLLQKVFTSDFSLFTNALETFYYSVILTASSGQFLFHF